MIACGYSPDYIIDAHDVRFTVKRNCNFILDLIVDKKLPASHIISSVFDWRDIQTVYEAIADRKMFYLAGILKWK